MPDTDNDSGVDVNNEGNLTVGGDVVGRDSTTTTTTTTTTTVSEGGPVARYAVIGVVVIAVSAIVIVALLASRTPPSPPPTPSVAATILSTTAPPASPTLQPSTDAPSPAPPATVTSLPPTPTEAPTATEGASPVPTSRPQATLTPFPISALAVYDDFDDNCLDASRWRLQTGPAFPGEPMPTPLPAPNGCLQAEEQFFTEGRDGHLSVFVSLEGDQSHSLVEEANACYKAVEARVALDDAGVFDANPRTAYLSLGLALTRVSGNGFLEVRFEGGNTSGRLASQITSRLTIPEGYQNFGPLPYDFHQLATVAFRVTDVGQGPGQVGAAKKIAIYVDGQPLGPSLSLLADPCGLTIGYHAEQQTSLDGYFDEVRLLPSE